MKKRNAFTLIELLAVIVILAIIALIATPIIINVIENARKKAFEAAAYGVLDVLKLDYIERSSEGKASETKQFKFPNSGLKISGEEPGGGIAITDSLGNISFVMYDKDKKWCARKDSSDEIVLLEEYNEKECKMDNALTFLMSKTGEKTNGFSGCTGDGLLNDEGKYGLRYQGKCPNNYVKFNDELWRIIGIVDGKVKIVRDKSIGGIFWDDGSDGIVSNDCIKSSLNQYLNNEYYKQINSNSSQMIDLSTWYLGGHTTSEITKSEMFDFERDKKNILSKIGLMYSSDYGYASMTNDKCESDEQLFYYLKNCKNTNWIYNGNFMWTLTANLESNSSAFAIYNTGSVHGSGLTNISILPALYLKYNVKIVSGEGTPSNPYILSM